MGRCRDRASAHMGDITTLDVDAIVNAANSPRCSAAAASTARSTAPPGPSCCAECRLARRLRRRATPRPPRRPRLPGRWVIHTVGPGVARRRRPARPSCSPRATGAASRSPTSRGPRSRSRRSPPALRLPERSALSDPAWEIDSLTWSLPRVDARDHSATLGIGIDRRRRHAASEACSALRLSRSLTARAHRLAGARRSRRARSHPGRRCVVKKARPPLSWVSVSMKWRR